MPGPVSDSYDPEFGTGANAHYVANRVRVVIAEINGRHGPELKNIVEVVRGPTGTLSPIRFSEREIRIIRFGLIRALESL